IDALVIIHPDYGKPINSNYKENMVRYVNESYSSKKPVFLVDSDEHPLRDKVLIKLFKKSYLIPNFDESDFIVKRQKEIDYICNTVHRSPSETILGFGGIHASCCVYTYALGWCKEVLTNFNPKLIGNISKTNPICQGIILDEIV
ncbi:hypothetical protein HYU21_02825, partial [Candidatus Woesearchaeota archaeon]|nr:hypothetical protein [Candidatus Woesearchaeota archaeon]